MQRTTTILWGLSIAALVPLVAPAVAHAEWSTTNLGGMSVQLYTPASTSPAGDGRGLMVVLHGCSQTGSQLQQYGNFEAAADMFGMVIALPNVPNGGVVAGCWDYYGTLQSRTTKHTGPIVTMTEALRDDASLGIDPDQMYMVGFSSGGGQALIVGCAAPDLFAGVGAVAAPGLGTTINQIGSAGTTGDQAAALCQQLAGSHAADLATQVGIVFNDSNDFTVAQAYNAINTEMFANVMSEGIDAMSSSAGDMASLPGSSPAGTETIYADAIGDRIARLQSMGVSHNWPAGSGSGGGGLTFVSPTGLNFSLYAADFFTTHNVRTGGWVPGGNDDGGSDGGSDGGGSDGGTPGDDSADDGGTDGGGSDDGGTAAGGDDDGTGGGSGVGGPGIQPGDDGYIEPTGCQCRATPDTRPTGWLGLSWLVLVAGATRRRRRS